jgi:hypothetical protein
MVNEKISNLFKVLVDQSRPIKGQIQLTPFQLIWDTKDIFDKEYGGISTKTFFLQELIDDMKDYEIQTDEQKFGYIDENVTLDELELTAKLTINSVDVQNEISSAVNKSYAYNEYSVQDGSNDRFMEKQRNTNAMRDTIFDNIEDDTCIPKTKNTGQTSLIF